MATVRTLARLERTEFADLLDNLTPDQWAMPSLCAGWTVRDVAAHTVAYLDQSLIRLGANMIRYRGDIDRLNAEGLRRSDGLDGAELADRMRRGSEPSGAAALYGGRVALVECLVHQQDIRRQLGLHRTLDTRRVRVCLDYARLSPVVGGRRRTRGLRLVATDMDWTAGVGPDVCGRGEALLLAMTGRAAAVSGELHGEGMRLLR
ncbi:maleylpyruvate isomerase family mycothiol-dependent enzyme [Mycolicibacterium baixiangningiae]|uniref:maleylpyruvate isomerase family mycothiol-dependent enzyme n=1 Tax=Mycolicibacterium baixiangningiae TaxID=2761578 RepID=UPI0018685C70|nr:maleylpyruvate isomerase family mycothiol-dependent enzyme [Mycolicibacterium baixiangningiae]